MLEIFRKRVESRGDATFLRFRGRSLSYFQMEERSNQAANLLREIGVRRGDKACLMISNRPEFLDLWFGLAKLGAIMVPLDASLGSEEVSYIASHSDATLFAVEEGLGPAAEEAARSLPRIRRKVWIGDNGRTPPGFLNYGATVPSLPRTLHRLPVTDPSDVMSIVYTPGTTGVPKGVMLSGRNYGYSGTVWSERVIRANPEDVFFSTLPLSRVLTQTLTVAGALAGGCRLVLGEESAAAAFLDAVRREGATVLDVSAPMVAALMDAPPRPDDRENPARLAFGGRVPATMRRGFAERFNVEFVEGFGLTECAGVCLADFGESARGGSIGKPLPGYDVKVVDGFDEELPTGISGEIVLRPRVPEAIFLGYYREHDRTAENMRNGWFHTGDRGYVDTEGAFFFLDRLADCVRQGGEIVSSLEIERIVNAHPKVLESAATGVLSEILDEDIRVFIVPRPGALPAVDEILDWCSGRIPSGRIPRYVEMVPELPKTSAGGIRKHELRKRPLGDRTPVA